MNRKVQKTAIEVLLSQGPCRDFEDFLAHKLHLAEWIAFKLDTFVQGQRMYWLRAEHVVRAMYQAYRSGLWRTTPERGRNDAAGSIPIASLGLNAGKVARLQRAGFNTLDDLKDEIRVVGIRGIGPKTLRQIRDAKARVHET